MNELPIASYLATRTRARASCATANRPSAAGRPGRAGSRCAGPGSRLPAGSARAAAVIAPAGYRPAH